MNLTESLIESLKIIWVIPLIVYKKTDEWNIELQRVTTSGATTNDNEWQQMIMISTTNDYQWQRVVQRLVTIYDEQQRVTITEKTSDSKWQKVIKWVTTNESNREQVKEYEFRFQNETKRPIWLLKVFIQLFM